MRFKARFKAFGALLGILAAVFLTYRGGHSDPLHRKMMERPASTIVGGRIISDIEGGLSEIVIHYTDAASSALLPSYIDFFRQLSAETIVHVACRRAEEYARFTAAMNDAGVTTGGRFRPLVMDCPITPWARDRFVARLPEGSGRRTTLVVPPRPEPGCESRNNDWFVPWKLASGATETYDIEKIGLFFHGGDLINDDETLFVDWNLIQANVGKGVGSSDEVIDSLRTIFGKRIVVIGDANHAPPDHHIEMSMTPLGGRTIMIGDPDLAVRILRDGDSANALNDADLSPDMLDRFRNVARQLEALGYRLIRVPLLPFRTSMVYVSYNNVVIETRGDAKIVYLPVYNMPALDNVATSAWEGLGFEVRAVDVSRLYRHRGAIRCLVNVLARRP